ncbi:PIK3R4 [Bugula neritina]|uniref:PIK3R4 n=1 Tax=Bugula neritina TaxID=10212 RepID=A0A7J7K8D2_BUGNE|nr:PIK3R4 [Bugula neritina]
MPYNKSYSITCIQTPDVRALFTGTDVLDSPTSPPQAPPPKPEVRSLTHQSSTERLVDVPDRGGNPTQRPGRAGTQYNTVKQSRCKLDLRTLVHHKRDEYADDYRNRASLVTNLAATEEGVVFPSEWKPRGILVAHSHEHKDSVTRLLVHPTNQFFMTASKDGTVKLWDTYKPDLKTSNMSKSRSTYQGKQGGKIMDMVFCTLDYWIACLTSKDSINLINIETGDQTGTLYHEKATLSCDTNNCGHIVAISPSEYGRRTVINYATVNGHIIGWDLRANRTIFTLKHSLDKGLVTSMTSHLDEKWVAVGTSQGSITLYDMRFQLPVNSIIHGSDHTLMTSQHTLMTSQHTLMTSQHTLMTSQHTLMTSQHTHDITDITAYSHDITAHSRDITASQHTLMTSQHTLMTSQHTHDITAHS